MTEQAMATVVGPAAVIRGELRCAGDLVVHGRIEGLVNCGGALRLEAGGSLEAEVRARSAMLAGRIRGDVSVVEAADLAPSCRMLGDLRAARVTIAPGAAVRGRVELGDVGSDDEAAWAFDADEAAAPTGVQPVGFAGGSDEGPAFDDEGAGGVDLSAASPTPEVVVPIDAEAPPVATASSPAVPVEMAQQGPPSIPASALALGVRSTIVIKR